MKLTKDEARILSSAMEVVKYEMPGYNTRESRKEIFAKLENLQERLSDFGEDHRRKGRTSMNDFSDVLKRYSPKK